MKHTAAVLVLWGTVLLVGCAAACHVRIAPVFADDPYWAHVAPKDKFTVLVTEGDLQRKYRPIRIETTGTVVSIPCSRSPMMARRSTNHHKGIASEGGGVVNV